jgi:hypothetical protein
MLEKKVFLIPGLLLLSMFFCFGCGEGTLELSTGNPGSPITQTKVRVDGEDKGTYDLAKIPQNEGIRIDLGAGGHVVGVDFLDEKGNVVSSYGPKIVKIEAGQTERIPIYGTTDNRGRYKGYNIAILTDFGDSLPFISATEGAIRAADPNANIILSNHGVPAFDITSGAFLQLLIPSEIASLEFQKRLSRNAN